MPPRKTTAKPTTPLTLDSLREAKRYVWRSVDRLEGRGTLRFKALDLNVRESEAIPVGLRTPLREAAQAIAPYIVEWDLVAEDTNTGEDVPVPVPNASDPQATAIAGEGNEWELLFVLDDYTVNRMIMWFKNPAYMKLQEKEDADRAEKDATAGGKSSARSASGDA